MKTERPQTLQLIFVNSCLETALQLANDGYNFSDHVLRKKKKSEHFGIAINKMLFNFLFFFFLVGNLIKNAL